MDHQEYKLALLAYQFLVRAIGVGGMNDFHALSFLLLANPISLILNIIPYVHDIDTPKVNSLSWADKMLQNEPNTSAPIDRNFQLRRPPILEGEENINTNVKQDSLFFSSLPSFFLNTLFGTPAHTCIHSFLSWTTSVWMIPLVRQRYDLVTPERSMPSSPSLSPAQITHENVNRQATSATVDVSELARLLQRASSSSSVSSSSGVATAGAGTNKPRPRSQLILTSKPPSPSPSSSTSSSPTLSPLPPPAVCTKEKEHTTTTTLYDKDTTTGSNSDNKPPLITVSTNNPANQRQSLHHRTAATASSSTTPTQFIFKKPEYDQHYHETHFHHHPPPQPSKKAPAAPAAPPPSTKDLADNNSGGDTTPIKSNNNKGIGSDRKDLTLTSWTELRRFFVSDTTTMTTTTGDRHGKDDITFGNQFRKNIGTRYGTWGK